MDKKKEKEALKRLEALKKQALEKEEVETVSGAIKPAIPCDAFRKNMGCGG